MHSCDASLILHLVEQLLTVNSLFFSPHFLIWDLPKIALTGDINDLLLASL